MTRRDRCRIVVAVALVLGVAGSGISAQTFPARATVPPGDTEQKPVTYEFGPGVSGPVIVEAGSSTIDTILRVWRLRPDGGAFLAGEDDNGRVGTDSRLAFEARDDERYRIEVRPALISWCGGAIETSWRRGALPPPDKAAEVSADAAYWLAAEQAAAAGGPVCVVEERIRRAYTSPPPGADAESLRKSAEETVALAEGAVGAAHPLYARSLWSLGDAMYAAHRGKEAVELHARAVTITEASLGPDHRALLPILHSLAGVLDRIDEPARAKDAFERAVEIAEKAYGSEDPAFGKALHNVGLHYLMLEQNSVSKPFFERSLSIFERAYGPDHPVVAKSAYLLGWVARNDGDYATAKSLYERALAIDEGSSNPERGTITERLTGLGLLAVAMGDYATAQATLERSLAVCLKGGDESGCSQPVYNLGLVYTEIGDFNRARTMYERALATDAVQWGAEHSYVADDLVKLARIHRELGDLDEAEQLCRRALAIHEKAFGADSPRLDETISALGNVLFLKGDLEGARLAYERVIAIIEKAEGPDHIELCVHLCNLSNVADTQKRFADGIALRARALAIAERVGNELEATHIRQDIAQRAVDNGDLAGAKTILEQTQASLVKMTGEQHPRVALNLSLLSRSRWGLGETRGALEAAGEAARISRQYARFMLRNLPERQALGFGASGREGLDMLLSVAIAPGAPPEAAAEAFDAVIRSRAIVLDEISARHRSVVTAGDSETVALARSFSEASRRLAALVLREAGGELSEKDRKQLEELRGARETAERALAERSASFRGELDKERFGFQELMAGLPEGSAIVAYVAYQRHTGSKKTVAGSTTPRWVESSSPAIAAFVVGGPGAPVSLVPIGGKDEVDALVRRWHEEAARGVFAPGRSTAGSEQAYRRAGEALRKKIWDPVAPIVSRATRVFVVPDGSLQLTTLAALPDQRGAYLVEHAPIQYLSAERDLAVAAPATGAGAALIVGDPAFDDTATFATLAPKPGGSLLASAATFRGTRSGCAGFRGLRFDPLPGTEREAADVAALWSPGAMVELGGAGATEAAFKADAPGKRLLHLATHGWFLGGECEAAPTGTRAVGGLSSADAAPAPFTGENPLLLSGLALAGANRRDAAGEDEEDGILTAEEIASLDLSGVEWAVLSACDTGVGEIKAGEGVFGLRRAFQVAGARTLIMSLWSVEDESARAWMEALYTARLRDHLDTADSVRAASLAVLNDRRAKKQSTHPFYWAGFVAAGDWR